MTTGAYISGAAHAALLVFALLGGVFTRSDPPEMTVSDVSVISEAEFAALFPPVDAPQLEDTPPAPQVLDLDATPPETPAVDAPPEISTPDPTPPQDTPTPAPEAPELAVPQADVTDDVAVIAPPTFDDGAVIAPPSTPAPAPRVAPEPAAIPEPETETAPELVEETAPVPDPEAQEVVEAEDAAAPEAATTEIVTEAEDPDSLAPVASLRPRGRPERPAPPSEPVSDPVADAVAAAISETPQPAPVPTGPPLTSGERDTLRLAVQQCWNVGSLSTEALRTTVVVGVSMAQDGKPDIGSIRMLGFDGGSEAAALQAYEAARRAIIRCGARGYDLPAEKYAQWREIEMTFNPERMRIR